MVDNIHIESAVDFNDCAGAIDRILIWIQGPSEKDAWNEETICGQNISLG